MHGSHSHEFLKKGIKTFKLIFFYGKIFTNKGVNFVWEESILGLVFLMKDRS